MTDAPPGALPSFLLPGLAERGPGERMRLDPKEARHARALRLGEGDAVALVDGRGTRRLGRLGAAVDREREVTIGEALPVADPLPVELCVAVGNRTHALWLVEKAAEFAVARLRLVETERFRSVADAGRSAGFLEKAGRRAVAAMKQSGGAWTLRIQPPVDLATWLRDPGPSGAGVLLDPEGAPVDDVLSTWNGRAALAIVIGPEGGLSPGEREACLDAGLRPAWLAPTVLRFETAAVAALAVAWQRRPRTGGGTPVGTSNGGAV